MVTKWVERALQQNWCSLTPRVNFIFWRERLKLQILLWHFCIYFQVMPAICYKESFFKTKNIPFIKYAWFNSAGDFQVLERIFVPALKFFQERKDVSCLEKGLIQLGIVPSRGRCNLGQSQFISLARRHLESDFITKRSPNRGDKRQKWRKK